MANTVKFYFLAPTWHHHPQTGTLQLGNVITSLRTPEQPIYRGPLPPLQPLDCPPEPGADNLSHSWQTSYVFSTESSKAAKFGLWTKFLSVLGLGIDAGVERDKSKVQDYTFERLETMEFQPSHEYIQECLKAAPVVRLINRKKRVFFVVTGIKAVTGAVAHSSAQTGHKTALGVEVDASVLGGVPISLGPKIDWEGKITQETSWKGSSDFVFAYRVQKLTVSRSGGVAQQDVTKGTMLGDDRRRTAESFVFDVSELNHDEVVDSGFKFEDASEGGLCAILLE